MNAPMRKDHGHIDFEKLPNTRDLGGLATADGHHIHPQKLLRSGTLYFASDNDLARLLDDYKMSSVVDLRGDEELEELPDPVDRMPDVTYVHVNVLKDALEGISQDAESRERLKEMSEDASEDPASFMEELYPQILLGSSGVSGYKKFIHQILDTTDGSALWHCYVGRDRCGMASMLIEHILGVPMDAIEDDYLATNLYTDVPSDERTAANLRFIRAAIKGVTDEFGSLDGYIHTALDVDDADIAELRGRYLTQ